MGTLSSLFFTLVTGPRRSLSLKLSDTLKQATPYGMAVKAWGAASETANALRSSHPLALSPSHPPTLSPSHPLTLSPSHLLTLSPGSSTSEARERVSALQPCQIAGDDCASCQVTSLGLS